MYARSEVRSNYQDGKQDQACARSEVFYRRHPNQVRFVVRLTRNAQRTRTYFTPQQNGIGILAVLVHAGI